MDRALHSYASLIREGLVSLVFCGFVSVLGGSRGLFEVISSFVSPRFLGFLATSTCVLSLLRHGGVILESSSASHPSPQGRGGTTGRLSISSGDADPFTSGSLRAPSLLVAIVSSPREVLPLRLYPPSPAGVREPHKSSP